MPLPPYIDELPFIAFFFALLFALDGLSRYSEPLLVVVVVLLLMTNDDD